MERGGSEGCRAELASGHPSFRCSLYPRGMGLSGRQITDDLELLLAVMPPRVREQLATQPAEPLIEIVLDLGRPPEARYPARGEELSPDPVDRHDLAYVVDRVGQFGKDNRAGIERTLHRISALRNRSGGVVGLTCRVGRAVYGTVDILEDVIASGSSILLLGRPGVGKTTLLREAARVRADEHGKRVIVVDTSNEIAGDGDIPHPGIGKARRMQVPSPEQQHGVMIEAVENHMPEVIVIDEIGTTAEAMAARTIAERGVQLIATAHGNTLENLLQNPTLSDLVGGIQAVTLSDEEARRRGTQKTVLERRAPPTFDVLIEIQDRDHLAVHRNVAEVVDRFLREIPPRPERRSRTAEGGVEIRGSSSAAASPGQDRPPGSNGRGAPASSPSETRRPARGQRPVHILPYAVAKAKLERAIRKYRILAVLVDDLDETDLVLTLKAQERRQPRRLRDAAARGIPIHVVKSNTIVQMENFLRANFAIVDAAADDEALREVEAGIDEALDAGQPVELAPRNTYLRRLQHQLIERSGLTSASKGEEPYRRVVIYPA
jgi:stage III sporulation protein SpoIIIAA